MLTEPTLHDESLLAAAIDQRCRWGQARTTFGAGTLS